MSSVVLDTRTPYQNEQTHLSTSPPVSQVGSAGLMFFRRIVQQLLLANHHDRITLRQKVVDRLRVSRDPIAYLNELFEQCVTKGGTDGLDIAIDVLSHFGSLVIDYAREFWAKDVKRWEATKEPSRHHMNDDVWYILLRAVAMSDLEAKLKLPTILYCAKHGPWSVREAGVHALGDIGGDDVVWFLREIMEDDPSPMVRETVNEVIHDLEG